MSNLIAIKGSKDGLRLQLDEAAAWEEVVAALRRQFGQGANFFHGAQIIVDIGERALSDAQLGMLLELMQQHGVRPEALASTTRESRSAARAAGLAARALARAPEPEERGEAGFIARTVRSGQVIRHHGHVTVLGDVNAGGEIIAGGNVIVWGRLRGMVHAGALGDRAAIIGALELAPMQLRIADLIARSPEGGANSYAEVAFVENEQINVEAWDAYRK
ncbi:septum site-determining protein MinC [Kouleothrix sp.]|uniref:septum site-determining protein MinC n=1 Tax=Kouleothrix sp. TaxID=2779161 RepID=UPI00391CC626